MAPLWSGLCWGQRWDSQGTKACGQQSSEAVVERQEGLGRAGTEAQGRFLPVVSPPAWGQRCHQSPEGSWTWGWQWLSTKKP